MLEGMFCSGVFVCVRGGMFYKGQWHNNYNNYNDNDSYFIDLTTNPLIEQISFR